MSGRWAVVDGDGDVVNVIVWDGTSEYSPGDGFELVELSDGDMAEPGGRRELVAGGKPEWVRAPRGESGG